MGSSGSMPGISICGPEATFVVPSTVTFTTAGPYCATRSVKPLSGRLDERGLAAGAATPPGATAGAACAKLYGPSSCPCSAAPPTAMRPAATIVATRVLDFMLLPPVDGNPGAGPDRRSLGRAP